MSVTCKDIMNLEICTRLKLCGGAEGLNKIVTWPYIKNMDTISEWIHGGELIFVIGAKEDVSERGLLNLMEEALANNISGVVMLCGEDYMKSIPKSVVQFANQFAIPLFKMPFMLKLIDITREISDYIVCDREKNKEHVQFKEQSILDLLLKESNREELLAYCWMKLQPLTEADKVLKSEYVVTLQRYLENNNSLIKTAEAMFIHRNTLVNRMKKIDSLLGVDLNQNEPRNEYYNIYKVLQYFGE
jgi:Purine catabolism regulatory protein-like family/PucR C-terminal helix-turn-helix domain